MSLTLVASTLCCLFDALFGEGGWDSVQKVSAAFPCPAVCLGPWGCEQLQLAPLAALWVSRCPSFCHPAGPWPESDSLLVLLAWVEGVRASGSSLGFSMLAGWLREAKLWDTTQWGC